MSEKSSQQKISCLTKSSRMLAVVLLSSCMSLTACMESIKTPEWLEAPSIFYDDADKYDKEVSGEDISSEELLDAEGEWAIVDKSVGYDPSQAHLKARGNVDPRRRKKMKELSAHFEPDAKSGKDHNDRVLLVDAGKKANKEDDDGFFGDIKSLFSGSDSSDSNVPIPKIKPVTQASSGKSGIITPPPLPARKYNFSVVTPQAPRETSIDTTVLNAVVSDKPAREEINWNAVQEKPATALIIKPKSKPLITKSPLPQSPTPQMKASSETKTIFNIRNGRHPGRTRLVLDISDYAEFKTKIDSIRNVLRIRIANADWDAEQQGKFINNSLLGSYIARKDDSDNSVLLEVRLRRSSRILEAAILPPSTTKYYRIMIDLEE